MKASVNGIDINYEIHGKEGAPWITFGHSLACSVRMWDPQIAAFKDRYRLLVHDMRGHGASSAPAGPYSLEQMAADVAGLLKHLGIQKTHFVGLSIGGMIGQILADKHAALLERVVLADTGHTQTPELIKQWEERIATAQSKGMKALVESTLARWFTEPFRKSHPQEVARIAAVIESTPVAGYVGCCQAISKMNLTSRLKEIRLPVLAITGEHDGSAPATKFIGETVPGAKFVSIAQAAHISNIEQPEVFNRSLREFLSSPASAPA
jgi:3-oxoadipate enol-lactonase